MSGKTLQLIRVKKTVYKNFGYCNYEIQTKDFNSFMITIFIENLQIRKSKKIPCQFQCFIINSLPKSHILMIGLS